MLKKQRVIVERTLFSPISEIAHPRKTSQESQTLFNLGYDKRCFEHYSPSA
jgi:hypothetical protein